jgi:hypothetical protein
LGEIFQEFSIEQLVIDTKKEPKLGGSGNLGLENARIRGVVNLGPAMVRGGFLKEGVMGGDGSERQTSAMVLEKKCDIIYSYTGSQVEWLRRNKYF